MPHAEPQFGFPPLHRRRAAAAAATAPRTDQARPHLSVVEPPVVDGATGSAGRRRARLSFGDPIDAINAATAAADVAGHDLAGFGRRVGDFGYRFVARCRRCRAEIVVDREPEGWGHPAPIERCADKD